MYNIIQNIRINAPKEEKDIISIVVNEKLLSLS